MCGFNRHTCRINQSRSWTVADDENPSTASLVIGLTHAYLRYKHKSQNGGGANEEPSAEESWKHVGKLFQGVGRDNNDCKHNAGDINGCCDILGIIKALDLHLAS